MARSATEPDFDRELESLPPELRWREWMRRIEAVLFASASPVPREDLARVVGQGASVDLLVADLAEDLGGRSFEVTRVAGGWMPGRGRRSGARPLPCKRFSRTVRGPRPPHF